ncbi:MAG: ThuA domain-containing protein [Balneolales bacterium]
MKKVIMILFAATPLLISCSASQTEEASSLSVLYVTGGGYHDYEAQQELLTEELSNRLDIDWTIDIEAGESTDHQLTLHSDPNWHEPFDAVIYNMCFAGVTDVDYVESVTQAHYDSGTAAIVLHCAMHTYRDADTEEWDRLIGFETYHHEHEQREFEIEALDREHPVMAGFPEGNWVSPTDELYINIKTYENLIPLAQAYGPETDAYHVVMWANTYGKARVVGTSAGHNNAVMEEAAYLDFLENGLLWATGK